jgi:hypothetical protein
MQFFKILYGFINANYDAETILKIGTLLIIQISILATVIRFRRSLRLKSTLILLVIEYIFRVVVNIFLLLRAVCMEVGYKLSKIEDNTLGDIEVTVMITLFGTTASQLFTAFFSESHEKRFEKI